MASPTNRQATAGTRASDEKRTQDASIVPYEDEYEKRNSSLQLTWSKAMEQGNYRTSTSYKHVAVLLLSWDKDFDDLGVREEVDALGSLFTETFNYDVHKVFLKSNMHQTEQAQMNFYVAEFVLHHGAPNTLLIVYYAGHAVPGRKQGHLELAGTTYIERSVNKVIWNLAEAALQGTQGDVLEIFDCCYAGDLGEVRGDHRLFEYLAATSAGSTTKSPGEKSFTSALIWSLRALVKESPRFTTTDILNKIKEAPHFPPTQKPVLSKRGYANTAEMIMLEPLVKDGEKAKLSPAVPDPHADSSMEEEHLVLKFVFNKPLREKDIETLGLELNTVMQQHRFHVSRIMWGGLRSQRSVMARAANRFIDLASRRRHSRAQELHPSPESGVFPPGAAVALWKQGASQSTTLVLKESIHQTVHHDVVQAAQQAPQHSVLYHASMVLLGIGAAIASLGGSFGLGAKSLRGVQGLIFLLSLAIGVTCFYFFEGLVFMYGGSTV